MVTVDRPCYDVKRGFAVRHVNLLGSGHIEVFSDRVGLGDRLFVGGGDLMPTWSNLNEAFSYIQKFLASKRPDRRFELSEIDLALVSNFKGGNASIIESLNSLPRKLVPYSLRLRELNDFIGDRPLPLVLGSELDRLGVLAKQFISLTRMRKRASLDSVRPTLRRSWPLISLIRFRFLIVWY